MNTAAGWFLGSRYLIQWPKNSPKDTPYTACIAFGRSSLVKAGVKKITVPVRMASGRMIPVEFTRINNPQGEHQ